MCPFCIATAALIAGSAGGTTGLAALVVTRLRKKNIPTEFPTQTEDKEDHHVQHHDCS
jgi:hypothetical protein